MLIHQKLYATDQLVGINSKEYFEDLSKDIFEPHQIQEVSLSYDLDIESMVLSVETITPLGLILNELILNVIKHAFEEIGPGSKLDVRFKQLDDELLLQVSDNGRGMSKEVKDSSFGVSLIKALSKKIGAELMYNPNNPSGTLAELRVHQFEILTN